MRFTDVRACLGKCLDHPSYSQPKKLLVNGRWTVIFWTGLSSVYRNTPSSHIHPTVHWWPRLPTQSTCSASRFNYSHRAVMASVSSPRILEDVVCKYSAGIQPHCPEGTVTLFSCLYQRKLFIPNPTTTKLLITRTDSALNFPVEFWNLGMLTLFQSRSYLAECISG